MILALALLLVIGGNNVEMDSVSAPQEGAVLGSDTGDGEDRGFRPFRPDSDARDHSSRRVGALRDVLDATPTPEPTPSPTPVYRVQEPAADAGDYPEALQEAVCRADFLWNCEGALRIATCEMGVSWRPDAIGLAGERGIFQIHPIHSWRWPDYYEGSMIPERNAEMAHDLWLSVGSKFSPTWSCATLLGVS